jgi:Ca2+-binding RTX toxin-like protein
VAIKSTLTSMKAFSAVTPVYSAPVHSGPTYNFIDGTPGDDQLWGTAADDSIWGHAGNDRIRAGAGNDYVFGGTGNDTLFGEAGNDTLDGGAGSDVLWGGDGMDKLWGGGDRDYLFGEAGDDTLHGGQGDDWLWGGDGDDWLEGGAWQDDLYGEAGRDVLYGGAGSDYLSGGSGADTFVFKATDVTTSLNPDGTIKFHHDRDVILDFSHDEGDKIDLGSMLLYIAGFNGTAQQAIDQGYLVLEEGPGRGGTQVNVFIDVNGAAPDEYGQPDVYIAILAGTTLADVGAEDFLVTSLGTNTQPVTQAYLFAV